MSNIDIPTIDISTIIGLRQFVKKLVCPGCRDETHRGQGAEPPACLAPELASPGASAWMVRFPDWAVSEGSSNAANKESAAPTGRRTRAARWTQHVEDG
nr:hypothetical protein [Anaerolineae bacterium]